MRLPTVLLACALALAGCDRGAKPAMVGSPAPEFTLADSGRKVSLADFRGKTVVLNFWATWCPPCIEEMPSLVAMQRQLQDKVVVLAVSVDKDRAAYERFVRQYDLAALETVLDPNEESRKLYSTTGLPETFVIDRNGVIRRKFVGPLDWTEKEILDYLAKL